MKSYKIKTLVIFSTSLLLLSSCGDRTSNNEIEKIMEKTMTQVTIKTSVGDIQLELNNEKAPITVENFKTIANSG